VDLETGVIVAAGADLANVSDQSECLERVDEAKGALEERGLVPVAVVADKGHHSGENLVGIEERGLIALISSPNHNRGAPGFRREDFDYDSETDTLTCPAGQVLTRVSKNDEIARHYKAKGSVCRSCLHFGICTKSRSGRAVSISVYEDVILANRERVHSEEARPLMQIRRQRGEAPFGYFKQFGGLRRFAGRGLEYAVKKTLIAALGWNLLILVKALMRNSAPNRPVSAFVQLLLGLWAAIQSILAEAVARNRRFSARSRAESTVTVWKAALSGGC